MGESDLVSQLRELARWLKALESMAHVVHLNYTGQGNFLSVHSLMKERYEAHLEELDGAAEFIRALGAPFFGTVRELQAPPEGFTDLEPNCGCDQMLIVYRMNLLSLIALAQRIEPIAQNARAIDVVDYCAQLVASSSKACWFLRATLGVA